MDWNLSEVKNRLSEVLTRAATEGPQTIRRRGEDFVLLRAADYEKLSGKRPTIKDGLLNGQTLDDVEVARDRSPMREVKL